MEEWITQFYKSKGEFGKNNLENRRANLLHKRRSQRNSVLQQLRQIPANMSPLIPVTKESPKTPPPKKNNRLEMLQKWKLEKEKKKLEAKKKEKPIFKVYHVERTENLDDIFSHLKGKKISLKDTRNESHLVLRTQQKFETPASKSSKYSSQNNLITNFKSQILRKKENLLATLPSTSSVKKARNNLSSTEMKNIDSDKACSNQKSTKSVSAVKENINAKLRETPSTSGGTINKRSSSTHNKNKGKILNVFSNSNSNISSSLTIYKDLKTPKNASNSTTKSKVSVSTSKRTNTSLNSSLNRKSSPSVSNNNVKSPKIPLNSDCSSLSVNDIDGNTSRVTRFNNRVSLKQTSSETNIAAPVKNRVKTPKRAFSVKSKSPEESNFMIASTPFDKDSFVRKSETPSTKKKSNKCTPSVITETGSSKNRSSSSVVNISADDKSPRGRRSIRRRLNAEFQPKDLDVTKRRNSKKASLCLVSAENVTHMSKQDMSENEVGNEISGNSKDTSNSSLTTNESCEKKSKDSTENITELRMNPQSSRNSIIEMKEVEWKLFVNDSYDGKKSTRKSSARKTRSTKSSSSTMESDVFFSPVSDAFKTPDKQSAKTESVVYISPFVTMSRGKSEARKEYSRRKSAGLDRSLLIDETDPRSPKAAAVYFTKLLNDEISRIQELCVVWQNYKESGCLSEDACGLIDMTIGQSNLLITKKFNQFRELIDKCRRYDGTGMKIGCEDLHGFWDMMYKQVNDLNKRFDNLEDMKKNNWLEEVPKHKSPKKTKKRKKGNSKPVTSTSSLLKETILAARRKKAEQQKSNICEVEILNKFTSPLMNKSMTNNSTPGRGILKSANTRSEKRKTVAFRNVRKSGGIDKENLSMSVTDRNEPTRKSERLSLRRSKLFES